MVILFNKYQGAGNDFIIIDNRKSVVNGGDSGLISSLCDRRFGIGADGLILINPHDRFAFRMQYFNADGFESSMCGNGGRCAAAFAVKQGITGNEMIFMAIDGPHRSIISGNNVKLQMQDCSFPVQISGNYFINTGSPHYVIFTQNARETDVLAEGSAIRWSDVFAPEGTNVNFVENEGDRLFVRTFERGVENETLSCGTGVTASAIVSVVSGQFDSSPVNIRTPGGDLSVSFGVESEKITNIWLEGPATFVFAGEVGI